MAKFDNLAGTTETSFQIGNGGPRIDASSISTATYLRDASGTAGTWGVRGLQFDDGTGNTCSLVGPTNPFLQRTYTLPDNNGTVALTSNINVTDSVTNTVLANMATQTIKGRTTAGTGDPEDLTATQARAVLGITDGGWVAPTLLNSWVNYGAPVAVAGYRKVGSLVTLRGGIKSGTITDSTTIFTLPANFRPTADRQWICAGQSSSKYNLSIDSLGVVRIFGVTGNTIIFLDGVSFHID